MKRRERYIMGIHFSREEMDEMEAMIKNFLNDNDVELQIPVDIFKVANELGFDVRGAELPDDMYGLILVNENVDTIEGFNSNKVIAYDCNRDIDVKKFTVGHELAHYIEKKAFNNDNVLIATKEKNCYYSNNKAEQKKDYMAAALIIPKEDLELRKDDLDKKGSKEFYKEMAERYKVNEKVVERRISEVFG